MPDSLAYDLASARREAATYEVASMRERRAFVRSVLGASGGERVASVGCGPGFEPAGLAAAVGESGEVVGVDASPAMLELARERCAGYGNVALSRGDVTALPWRDESVDAAAAVQVYEYVEDVDAALAELARVLRPGGRAVVYATDWDSVVWRSADRARMARVLDAWTDHCARPHLGSELEPRLRDAGVTVERVAPYTVLNTRLDEDVFAHHFLAAVADYVADHEAVGADEAAAWAADLRARDDHFFSLTQYLYAVRKPA